MATRRTRWATASFVAWAVAGLVLAIGLAGCEGDTGAVGATGVAGLQGPPGADGAPGTPGAPGADGAPGATGPSAFAPLPSGAVVRGTVGWDGALVIGQDFGLETSLPASPQVPLDDAHVIVQTGTWTTIDSTQGPVPGLDPDQALKGDPAALCPIPTDTGALGFSDQMAELGLGVGITPGHVCVYVVESDHADAFAGFGRGSGFKLLWLGVDDATGVGDPADNANDMFVTAVWVYREP